LDSKQQLKRFLAHLKAGRKDQANEILRQVLADSPSKAGPYALLIGGMLAQNGQFREAVPLYEEAIRVNPEDPAAYFYLGVAYHALKEDGECDRIWDQLAERFPGRSYTHYQNALRSLKADRFEEAKVSLQKAIELIESDNPLRDDAMKTLALIDQKLAG
jgi:tetratricopeptide (TPR) repeat protein